MFAVFISGGRIKLTEAIVNLWGGWAVYLTFAAGLIFIIKGGDFFVDSASWMAEASGIPKFIVGATIVSLATTLPELIVSCIGAANGTESGTALAIGNAIGSVTANTGLILSVSILFMPAVINRRQFTPKGVMLPAAVALLFVLSFRGCLTVGFSLILFALFGIFIYENLREGAQSKESAEKEPVYGKIITKNLLMFAVGTAGIVVGSNLLVDSGTIIAKELGIPDRIVGLTMVAIGTSLPELVTAVTAIVKKETSLSVGNILGANIIDTALILPICAVIKGGALPVEPNTLFIDIPVCFLIVLIAVVPTIITKRLNRWQGVVMITGYLCYLAYMCI